MLYIVSHNVYACIVILFVWRISQTRVIQDPNGGPDSPGTTFGNQNPSPTTNAPTTTTTNTPTMINTSATTDKPDVTTPNEDIKNDAEESGRQQTRHHIL